LSAKHEEEAEIQLAGNNAAEGKTLYTPAAGYHWLTPFYDFGVAALTREHRWRNALVAQVRPRAGEVIVGKWPQAALGLGAILG